MMTEMEAIERLESMEISIGDLDEAVGPDMCALRLGQEALQDRVSLRQRAEELRAGNFDLIRKVFLGPESEQSPVPTYYSPVSIVHEAKIQLEQQTADGVYKAVAKLGINVDKEEMLRALKFDRQQYEAGYSAAKSEVVYCRDCTREWCPMRTHMVSALGIFDPFCAAGLRHEGEDIDE